MTLPDLAIRGTAWLAMAGYFVGAFLLLRARSRPTRPRAARWAWAAGCDLYFWHVLAAFHFRHDWSHANAVALVAQQSDQLIGRPIEAGIWFNYALMLAWAIDATWLWFDERGYFQRSKSISWALHGFILFMVINGAIVFAPAEVRWPSAAAFVVLAWAWWRR
jgi:hypothetical protein